ncbi:hypothetical protein BGZ83_010852 [Gryganskiella cystojenkinii]|nr:hypothetical protein BGZ83_010852 [Gryganskiella cystojenkinii]
MVIPELVELKFRRKLNGTPTELLKKLKELQGELKDMDQGAVETSTMTSITKQLVDPSVVNHKDRGVRIYAACCIADLLRLYAPDAPYGSSNLKLRHISEPNGTYFSMYYYLLESLSAVKSIILITDLKNADEIMVDLFRNMFDNVRPQQEKNVQICVSELLRHVLDEAKNVPQEIVDIIIAQFLDKQKFDNPAAHRLACDLGTHCAEKLQRYVFQYFADTLSTTSKGELTHEDYEDFKSVHNLVVELNKATPALLLNVIPQLEEELRTDDVTIRSLATDSLGAMFAEKTSQLASQYESTWKAWLQRRNDKIPSVRILWVQSVVELIKAHGSLAKELCDALEQKIVDPDERIRIAVCKAIGQFDYETSLHHLQKSLLIHVGHRCRDKKKSVTREAINTLSVLYNQAYPEIENGTKSSISQFAWMPSAVLHALYVNDVEVYTFVDNAVYSTIFPPQGSAGSRTRRLVTTYASLDDKGRTGLLLVLRRSVETRSAMTVFLRLLEQQETASKNPERAEEIEKKLGAIIKILSDQLPDPTRSSLLLYKYTKFHDHHLFKSISDCMDSSVSVKDIRKASKDALARIENISPPTLEVFSIIIQRIGLTIANYEVVSELIKNIANDEEHREISGELLRGIAPIVPDLFKDHVAEITSLLRDEESAGVSDSLQTLAEFAKQFPKSIPADAKAKCTLESFLEKGTIEQACHATVILASIPDNERLCKSIAEDINDRMDVTSDRLLKDLAILAQMVQYCPSAFEAISGTAVSFIIKQLIMTNIPEQEDMYPVDSEWVEKADLDRYSLSKIMGLKILVNRVIAVLVSNPEIAQETARPVFKLLWTIIGQEGEVVPEQNTNAVLKGHLRLNAARYVLKLTRNRPEYEKMVTVAEYRRLALTIQDPFFKVRQGFASRIIKYVRSMGLHVRYLAVLVLAAHEPESGWRDEIRKFLSQMAKKQENADNKMMMNELTIARLVHLLANHPDFVPKSTTEDNIFADPNDDHSVEDITLTARYIEFYLDAVANAQNVSLIFYIASMLKTVKFANTNERTKDLYVVSDLAQYLIQERSRAHNWILTSYPGQVKLPRELFSPLGQSDISVEISKKNYLSQDWVKAREHKAERRPRQPVSTSAGAGAASSASSAGSTEKKMGQASKRRSRSPSSSEDEDDGHVVNSDEEHGGSSGRGKRSKGVKRSKRAKAVERSAEPTRRMASRAAKAKTAYKEDASSDEDEEVDELQSDNESD